MKKLVCFFGFLFSFIFITVANATYTSSYADPEFVDSLNFSAELQNDGSVKTNWSAYTDDLKYYKVSRSQTNSSPVYPDDGYIFYSSSATEYLDKTPPTGTNYYRVCAITNSNKRFCSNVVKLQIESSGSDGVACIQVITYAKKGDECKSFATPCSVPAGWTVVDSCEVETFGDLKLEIELKDKKPYLTWDFDGAEPESYKGYKIAISTKNKNPTYPVMSGDSYQYLSNKSIKSYRDSGAKAGEVYYYRVCVYFGEKCTEYSNAVTIAVPAESTDSNKIYEKEKETTFSDVKAGVWFESYLSGFVKRGIIEGYSDGSFQPSKTVNRAEMAKMVVKALDVEMETSDMEIFCDVSKSDWFQPYVLHLYFDSVIEGFTGGSCSAKRIFKPAQEVTRAEGIKIILTMFDASVEPLSAGDQTGFTDVPNSHWASAYVRTAFSLGIVNGYDDGTFQPNTPLTRAEFVKMLSEAEKVLK